MPVVGIDAKRTVHCHPCETHAQSAIRESPAFEMIYAQQPIPRTTRRAAFTQVYYTYSVFFAAKIREFPKVPQIDFVPTFSLLLGIPIPYGNLGGIIPELFLGADVVEMLDYAEIKQMVDHKKIKNEEVQAAMWRLNSAMRVNILQIRRYLETYPSLLFFFFFSSLPFSSFPFSSLPFSSMKPQRNFPLFTPFLFFPAFNLFFFFFFDFNYDIPQFRILSKNGF
jgi:hypothetical protein